MAAGCSPETQESRMHINYFADGDAGGRGCGEWKIYIPRPRFVLSVP